MDNGVSSYRRFIDGDKSAFEEIMDLYREPLIFFITRYTGNIQTAEDLAEDVFVELIVHPDRYDFRASLKTYIFKIARNKAVDYIRKHRRFVFVSDDSLHDVADFMLLEEHVIREEEKRDLSRALDKIKEEYRTAIHLVYLENLSYDEAGSIMNKDRKQIENLIYRGKKAVKAILEKEGFHFEE